jgi:hypothetical protein
MLLAIWPRASALNPTDITVEGTTNYNRVIHSATRLIMPSSPRRIACVLTAHEFSPSFFGLREACSIRGRTNARREPFATGRSWPVGDARLAVFYLGRLSTGVSSVF